MAEKMALLSSYLDDGGWHTEAENVRNGVDLESYENELHLIAWLMAHLAQPAQAVDALQDAIFQIAERLGEIRDPDMDDMSWHTQLIARAQYLANAQAVDVEAIREVIVRLRNYDDSAFNVWADELTLAIGDKP